MIFGKNNDQNVSLKIITSIRLKFKSTITVKYPKKGHKIKHMKGYAESMKLF